MKKIFLPIVLTLIFGISNVYAESCTQLYSSDLVQVKTVNLTQGNNLIDIDLTNNIDLSNYEYYKFNFFYYLSDNSTSYTSNINITETCPHSNHIDSGENYVITYADGSQAQVSGTIYYNICNGYNQTGTQTITQYYEPEITTINGLVRTTTPNNIFCQFNKDNGELKCPKTTTIDKLRFYATLSKKQSATMRIGAMSGYYMGCNSDTQQIINNNNQNTQTIVNNITDDNITGNDSNTAINNIGDTFDTENDFLLGLLTVPYNFFNSLLNIFEDNCTSLNLGTMFEKPLVFPCISLDSLLGNVFTNVIDVIFCGIIMSAFLRRMVKYYQALLSLDERATQIGGVKIW